MTHSIKKVAVLGSGTMGGGIAAHCVNAGLEVVLLDMAPTELTPEEEAKGLTLESKAVRNRFVTLGMQRVKKSRPAALFLPEYASRITTGNFTDDLELIADADWIVEVIVEQLAPKRALMERVEQLRKPGSIVSSNTSGIPIASIAEGRSEEFRRHFLGTHFFNPPRYLYLLEVIPTADTDPAVVDAMIRFGDEVLGKGVVIAKDRPNFIGNRIGIYVGQLRMHYALEHGYTVEEVDNLTGELIGNPRTATFRLQDLVGIDVAGHVAQNLYESVPEDEEREMYRLPPFLQQMLERRWLGNKTGFGFYKQEKGASGKEFWSLNLQTLEHEPPQKVRFELVGKARKIEDLRERLRFLMEHADMDRAGQFLRDTTLRILAYSSRRIPEISDSIADVDNAIRWGFSQQLGPFETWDALGVRKTAELMQQHDITVAPWVTEMLEQGIESFYQTEKGRVVGVYSPAERRVTPLTPPEGVIDLNDLRAQGKELARNESASILDLGDGVLCLEFHSKMNALDPLIAEMGQHALKLLDEEQWKGMVIGNQGENFCVGANIALLAMSVASGQIEQLREVARQLQGTVQAFRLARKPIVTAPHGRVLGGGAEVAMAGARQVAAAETYIGQVELGVGLIPGAGGCKEFLRRQVSPHLRTPHVDAMPYLQRAFETIALAKVGESVEQSRQLGFLSEDDKVVMNKRRLIAEAKRTVLKMVEAGYTPPPLEGEPIYAIGRRGIGVLNTGLHGMRIGKYISEYDQKLAQTLAFVMCGGDLTNAQWVTEQYILDLEREKFLELAQESKTQERIMGMLQSGKPVRN